jgi:LPS sulfotransferase NodH
MLPVRSYLICATHRSGSQMLCDLLRSTRVAGWPAEYFLPREEARRYQEEARRRGNVARDGVARDGPTHDGDALRIDAAYLARMLRSRVTRNGVFGMQVMQSYFEEFVDWLRATWPGASGRAPTDALALVFGDLRYVHLHRRDKVRQAISLIRARRTAIYGREGVTPPPFREPFSFELMQAHVAELERQDDYWLRLFSGAGVEAIRVCYEELDERPGEIVMDLLRRLEIAAPDGLVVGPTRLRRQADALSDEWVARYHELAARPHDAARIGFRVR